MMAAMAGHGSPILAATGAATRADFMQVAK